MLKTTYKQGVARPLRIEENLARFLAFIAANVEVEVMVLLLGDLVGVARAAFVSFDQKNTRGSVFVDADAQSRSVATARKNFEGLHVIGVAHLHPFEFGAFASTVDWTHLETIAPLLAPGLLTPTQKVKPLDWSQSDVVSLDTLSRKCLRRTDGAAHESSPGSAPTPGTPSKEAPSYEYVETHMTATIFSLTFSPDGWRPDPGKMETGPLAFSCQALRYLWCCDPACASKRGMLIDAVPVEIVPSSSSEVPFWNREELSKELSERVSRCNDRWNDRCKEGGVTYYHRSEQPGDFTESGRDDGRSRIYSCGTTTGSHGYNHRLSRRKDRSDAYRILTGKEDLVTLMALLHEFTAEVQQRVLELSRRSKLV